ncbi:MAG TPA: DUF1259 domain-containing protein [Longimicrobiaceae bacterium]|nr:DUF1259 domain-containing protein [Longimicrobiaceae bacterium]
MTTSARWIVIASALTSAAACITGYTPPADAQTPAPHANPSQDIDWKAVDAAMGRSGSMQSGGVYRFGMPRTDLSVTSKGVQIKPSLALGSWIAMKQSGPNEVVAMGDLVLTDDELNRVITRLQRDGIGQTAIHKHLLEMSPAIWWTHVHAHGNPIQIARTVREALALTGTPAQSPGGGNASQELGIDTAQISRILGHSGRNNSGVYSVSVPRAETVRAMGIEVPPSMGLSTAINFQPTGGGRAAINGDFVMTSGEIDRVISALRENGIQVVALHNHLTDEEPRLFFMHFWANDDAVKLARGLRAALDQTNSRRGAAR